MSGNSLANLLAWMKDNSRMLDWGMIVALERRKTNLIILQEYIKRFGEGSYLAPVTGEVMLAENRQKTVLHNYVMDVPVLSFENANLNDSKAMLTMSVMGGAKFSLGNDGAGWKVHRVDEIEPLKGPKLYLDLLLKEATGDVDKDGRIMLDLSKSDEFRMTNVGTEHEGRQTGYLFQELFNRLPANQRIYPLGKIERGMDVLMRPQSFELRTQASSAAAARDPKSSEYGDGAVLAFVRMQGRLGGHFPGDSYKYLIPDDQGKDYSATVLLDRKRVAAVVMVEVAQNLLDSDDFEYVLDEEGNVESATFSSGTFVVPQQMIEEYVEVPNGDKIRVTARVPELRFSVSDSKPLIIKVVGDKISLSLKSEVREVCYLLTESEEGGIPAPGIFSMDLYAEYELGDRGGEVWLERTHFDPNSDFKWALTDDGTSSEFWEHIILAFLGLIIWAGAKALEAALQAVGVKLELDVDSSISEAIQELLKLNFGQAIQGEETYVPNDIGFFGRINPQLTTFLINPMQPVIKADTSKSRSFATIPVVAGVQWRVENLVEGSGSPGTINASGVYTPPDAKTITGRFTRVRITATSPDGSYTSSALVTVVVDELSIHPFIQVCQIGDTVDLSAGVLERGKLEWSIKNPVPGESGELILSENPDFDYTYHHGPVDDKKTYVIDQIEVKNDSTGGTRSMHVLALQKQPMVSIKIISTDAALGLVQLQASINGTTIPDGRGEWRMALAGQGTIDKAKGLYRSNSSDTARFALILFAMEGEFGGTYEGHFILPLPLVEFPQLFEVLSK